MSENPNYYAIIPANVRYDERLKPNEKLLYGEISALSNKNGRCHAKNSYFAKLYGVEKATISRWINNLKEKEYVLIDYKYNKKEIIGREIVINPKPKKDPHPIDKKRNTLLTKKSIPIDKKRNTLLTKKSIPIDKKRKDNNTSINTTRVNNTSMNNNNYKAIFDYYNNSGIIKHRNYNKTIADVLKKFMEKTEATPKDMKKIIDIHKWKTEKTKNKDFPIRKRAIKELFGQKKYRSEMLIAEDYLPEGKYYREYHNIEQKEKKDIIEEQYEKAIQEGSIDYEFYHGSN